MNDDLFNSGEMQGHLNKDEACSEREAIDTELYGKGLYDIYGDEPDILDFTHFI